jgi:hypothetical protein
VRLWRQDCGTVRSAAARDEYNRFIAIAPSRFAAQISDAKQRLAALH